MRDFITFSQVINKVVGKLSDVASTTGSVLSRLKYIIDTGIHGTNTLVGQRQKPRGARVIGTSAAGTGTSYATAYSYTGIGELLGIRMNKATTASTGTARITIDGSYVVEYNIAAATTYTYPTDLFGSSSQLLTEALKSTIPFKTSILIELKTAAGGAAQAQWVVGLE